MTNLGNDWDLLLKEETEQPYMEELRAFLREEYRHYNIYPPKGDMFLSLIHIFSIGTGKAFDYIDLLQTGFSEESTHNY